MFRIHTIMGNKICTGTCASEDMTLSTPIGQCGCGKSVCSCFSKETEAAEDILMIQIKEVMKSKLANVEAMLKQQIINSLDKYGDVPAIHVLEHDAASPSSDKRIMTVRIKECHPCRPRLVEPIEDANNNKMIKDDKDDKEEYKDDFIREDVLDVVKDHEDVMD